MSWLDPWDYRDNEEFQEAKNRADRKNIDREHKRQEEFRSLADEAIKKILEKEKHDNGRNS